ncbi:PQQ-dependent sugar dehydrogenase [Nocardia higoensis]|uniref:PQQ-dependent sugar dehydrogenase n=1 Tax=Nocardia higoensis TaxID=228599 RepID=A0ABS0DEZ7_9NOCA|nr:PQQ-dependent sugar dehydrogenase [Nocardia higoensis]MBF6357042.1 PQQ-dependent sugar dehydrogenase [Nocardia higoensis]
MTTTAPSLQRCADARAGGRRSPLVRAVGAAVAALSVLTSCSGSDDAPAPTTASASAEIPGFEPEAEIARGINVPWGLAFLPDGAALVAERDTARILRIEQGLPPQEVYRVPDVVAEGEGGLLGLALSPTYADDGYVYAYFTAADDNRIVRFRLDGAPQPVFTGIAKANNHNGGRIAFGPDGMLYAGTGDAEDPDLAQDPASPNGKILRLTPEGSPAPGNPTTDSPVYSLGHRNVQGLAWDSAGRLFAADFGQNLFDEINRIEPGRNYGWPAVQGGGGADDGYTDPVLIWTPSEASPSGIAITRDTLYVAALRGKRLWTAPLSAGTTGEPRAVLDGTYGRLRTVTVAPDGALWLTTSNTDGRGDVRDGDDRVLRFPRQNS